MLPHIDDFLKSLENLSYSPETIYNYERDLKVFEQFLDEAHIDFDKVDKKTIVYYKAYLTSQDRKTPAQVTPDKQQLGSRSINRMLSAVRSFLKYLVEMDHPCPISSGSG